MGKDTIKKSVDIPEKDKTFIENKMNNFSAEVRRFIGLQKLARSDNYDLDEIRQDIEKIAQLGQQVKEIRNNKKEEILTEYDAEIVKQDRRRFQFKIEDDGQYMSDWRAQAVESWETNGSTSDKAQEIAEKISELYFDKWDVFIEKINKETDFHHIYSEEDWMGFQSDKYDDIKLDMKNSTSNVDEISLILGGTEHGRTYPGSKVLDFEPI